jgi:putative nucleotidyltransferase with HDIG domain
MDIIQEIILTHFISEQMDRPLPGYALQRGELWQHALGTAIGAKLISKQRHLKIDEEAYFAGLLCDIGKLAFEKPLRGLLFSQSEWGEHSFLEIERATFGVDHAMLGAEIARRWQLPENLVAAIAHHHQPLAAQECPSLVAAIHVADISMMLLGIGVGVDGLRYPLEEGALKYLDMGGDDLLHLVEQVSEELIRAKELIYHS